MMFPDDKNLVLTLDRLKNLSITQTGANSKLLARGVISFDAFCSISQNAEVFLSTDCGSLVWVSCNGEKLSSQTLLTSKNAKKKICAVKVIGIHGRYHLFYCLDSEKRYLVHQIVSMEEVFNPVVIDTIGRRFVYDIAADEDYNIHIAYRNDEGLCYRRYVYSEKRYTPHRIIKSSNPCTLCIGTWEDRAYVVFAEDTSGILQVLLADVSEDGLKKNIMSLSGKCDMCINCCEDGIVVHVADGGVCYEIKSNYNLEFHKPKAVGKCSGIQAIRCAYGVSYVRYYPVNRYKLPLESYNSFRSEETLKTGEFYPVGREADKFANRYARSFTDKADMFKAEELLLRLTHLEKTLEKLSEAMENFAKKDKDFQSPSF